MFAEPIRILLRVSQILENLEIPYLTGGSVASSIFGIPRATQDVDLVVDLPPDKVSDFVKAMQPEFYVDLDAVAQAVHRRSSFNMIHFETVQKVDIFIKGSGNYASEEMRRRLKVAVDKTAAHAIFTASPEDIILQKLVWYKMGSQISERQWNDVLGIIKVQGDRLDRGYITYWAKELSVADLADEAFLKACD